MCLPKLSRESLFSATLGLFPSSAASAAVSLCGRESCGFNAVSVGLWRQDQHCDLDAAVLSPLNSEDAVDKTKIGDFIQVLGGWRQPRGIGIVPTC